jgi:putative ABC transport system permease protein
MNRKIHLLVLRDIMARRFQFGALAIIIALGIAIFVAMTVAFNNAERSYDRTYEATHFADFSVEVNEAPESVIAEVGWLPNVEAVEGRVVMDTGLPVDENRLVQARLIGVPADRRAAVNDVIVESGRYFEAGERDVVLVLDKFADFHGYQSGDTIQVYTLQGLRPLTIVGTVSSPEYLLMAESKQDILPSPRRFGVFFVPNAYLQELFGMEGQVNEVHILVESQGQREETIAAVSGVLEPYGVQQTVRQEDQPSKAATELDLEGGRDFAILLPTLVLVIAAFAIYIAMSRLVRAQRTLIGLFRGVGYGKGSIVVHYLLFAVVIGVVGGSVGVAAGYGLGYLLTGLYADALAIPLIAHEFQLTPIVVSVIVSLAVALVAAAAPAWAASRMLPAPAMRPSPEVALAKGSVPFVERIFGLGRRPPLLVRLGVRNIWRSPMRSLYTVGAIALAAVLLVVGLSSFDSMDFIMDRQFEKTDRWDVAATFWSPQDDQTLAEINDLEGVRRAEPIYLTPAELRVGSKRTNIELLAVPEDTRLHGFDLGGGKAADEVLSGGGIILAKGVADKLDVGVGDRVDITTEAGLVEGDDAPLVSGISKEFTGGLAYVSLGTKDELGLPGGFNAVWLETASRSDSEEVQAALYQMAGTQGVQIKEEIRDDWNEMMSLYNVMAGVIVSFCMVMAGAIVFNTMTVNVLERERETATMRTLGAGRASGGLKLVAEGLIFSLLAILPGLALGTMAASYLIHTWSSEFFTMWFHMYPTTYVMIAAAIIVAALMSTVPSIWHSNRMNLAEATKVLA